jgi:dephospho-CoA kinase
MKLPRIIAFTGLMGSGKSTALEILESKLKLKGIYPQRLKFAEPLYEMQEAIYRIAGLGLPVTKDRKLLQWLGTEWGRDKDENLWTKRFLHNVDYRASVTLNDDVRFNNEAEAIRKTAGVIVKIMGPQRCEIKGENHVSENGLRDHYVDYYINNDGSISDLSQQIDKLLEFIGGDR